MLHFVDKPTCAALKLDKDPRISSVKSFHWFCSWQRSHPDKYCAECAATSRTDSDRYTELRKLVEAWQEAHRQHDQARTTAPETEGWLKHWLNFCDAQKPLLDWSHR